MPSNGVQADIVLLDLGVSSMQIDRPERGFSYAVDAPLDMRMDPGAGMSAEDVVNELSERELADIFKRYGEERYARQIARAIVRRRREQTFERTGDLVDVIKARDSGTGEVRRGASGEARLPGASDRGQRRARRSRACAAGGARDASSGGRLGVISFHSLEDRIVKQFLRREEQGCTCPPDFPMCVCGSEPTMRATPRRAIRPTAAEIARNPRAQSARLRVRDKGG